MSGGRAPRPRSWYPYVLALFATVLYFALVVCVFGFISLFADTEVVEREDAGLFVGLSATVASVLTVGLRLLRAAARPRRETGPGGRPVVRIPVWGAVVLGVVSWLVYGLVGGVLYAIGADDPAAFLFYAVESLTRPFGIAVGVLAALVFVAYALVFAGLGEHPARPLWPWERPK